VDPFRIVVRVLFAYVLLLLLVRLSGKRSVKHGSPVDFTVALILGDMVDDVLWAEVSAAAFVVATGALMTVHVAVDLLRVRAGAWR
jgi:uncharacterized membrane protein YcaP (DUF421 family)